MSLQLRIIQGHNQGLIIPLKERNFILGRAASQGEQSPEHIFFYEATVSRIHGELQWDEKKQGFFFHHRSPTNKTLVDNQNVDPKQPRFLNPGCKIQMGLLILTLERVN